MHIKWIAVFLLSVAVPCAAEPIVNFSRDVRPILSDRCFQCHGPSLQESDLRLDQGEGEQGAYRELDDTTAIIRPGSIENSELWRRITSTDDDRMPPPEVAKEPLDDEEREIIRRWIEAGAPYERFWAFVTPTMPALPEVEDKTWSEQPIDRFVLRRLEDEGLRPSPQADRRTLIRRLSLDLTGLPPMRQEILRFLDDRGPGAYERLVDRLLAKPQFGEHMTKYWLDLVRFADTNGIHHDHYREMTPYRDWVIRAFNQNLPYDEFVKYQLAGDLYPEPTRDQLIASGFNRLHLIIDRGTALPEESFTRNVIDRVTAVGTAFLGLTVQCAVCHNHKYDPITTKDFYQLYAFFNNLDADPETGGRQGSDFERGLQPPYIYLPNDSQQSELENIEAEIARLRDQLKRSRQKADPSIREGAPSESNNAQIEQAKQALAEAEHRRNELRSTIPVAMVMKERNEIRPAHILIRGAYDNPGEVVERGTPNFLPPMISGKGPRTRMDLAEWFIADDHPLTARVAVNRFWQQLFGVGIVKTSEDFGAQGTWPSHPDLLDYLAVSFIQSDWNIKEIIKQMVMSQTYRQSSEATPEVFRRDPENRWLARGSRYRLDAEVIRDQILLTSGLLSGDMYGKSVKPPQPKGLWDTVTMPSSYPRYYEADSGERIYRRSVYTFWKRGMPPPQMTILNAPTREACITRRERTNTPLQALLLMNEPEYIKAARQLARTTLANPSLTPNERLVLIFETITSQLPDREATDNLLAMVDDLKTIYRDRPDLAHDICDGAQLGEAENIDPTELAAWTVLVSTIYNLDITKTRS